MQVDGGRRHRSGLEYVRRKYDPHAVETPRQKRFVRHFR
jgi:hypothetical protein